jgi:hypothetical protein
MCFHAQLVFLFNGCIISSYFIHNFPWCWRGRVSPLFFHLLTPRMILIMLYSVFVSLLPIFPCSFSHCSLSTDISCALCVNWVFGSKAFTVVHGELLAFVLLSDACSPCWRWLPILMLCLTLSRPSV